MTKTEWDEMEKWEKITLVAKLMGWSPPKLVPEFGVEYTTQQSDYCWMSPAGNFCFGPPDYISDRNACALVLDEIGKRELEEPYFGCLMDALFGVGCWHFDFDDDLMALMSVHNVDPGTACFCAVKAVEDK